MQHPIFSNAVDERWVQRARELCPLITRHAAQTEAQRQVVPEVIEALETAGLFEILVPQRLGGIGATMATQLAVAAELGTACVSTAWVQTLLNITTWGACLAPVASTLFAPTEPRPRFCGVFTPTGTARRTAGGYVVSGRWGYASGSFHANWFSGSVFVQDEQGQPLGVASAMIPRRDLSIEDTWFVAGVAGSASNTVIAQEVFVPAQRLMPLTFDVDDAGIPEGAEGSARWPLGSALSVVLVGPLLGAARGCADIVTAQAPKRAMVYTHFASITQSPVAVSDVARARLDIDTAWMHAFQAAAYLDGLCAGAPRDLHAEARLRGQCGYLLSMLRQGVDTLLNVAGASSFAQSSMLQRHWRDLNVGSRHAFLLTSVSLETYGRKLFGLPPVAVIV